MKKYSFFLMVLLAGLAAPALNAEPVKALMDRAPGQANLIAPLEGAEIPFTNQVEFVWSQTKRALKYTVYVGKDGKTFTNVTVFGAAETNLVVEAPFRAGNYTWMVLARNTNGAGPWSTTVTFRVQERMMSPGGGERLAETNPPVFRWEDTPDATLYQARIAIYKSPEDAGSVTNSRYRTLYEGAAVRDGEGNWAPTGLVFKPAAYRWQVREKRDGAWAPWSTPSYFRIDVPAIPQPLMPARASLIRNHPTFKWVPGPKLINVYFQIRVWKDGVVVRIYSGMSDSPFAVKPLEKIYWLPGPGRMSWQIRAFEYFPGNILRYGPWSEAVPFTVQ